MKLAISVKLQLKQYITYNVWNHRTRQKETVLPEVPGEQNHGRITGNTFNQKSQYPGSSLLKKLIYY